MALIDQQDPLMLRLRNLPPHAPDGAVDAIVMRAGLDGRAGREQAPNELGWFGKIVVPAFLSLTTLSYLWWAVNAAGSLYL